MRVFKTRVFDRWAGKAGVTDTALLKAVADIERGLIDADLGSNLFKHQSLASTLVMLSNEQIETALKANELMEVQHEPND